MGLYNSPILVEFAATDSPGFTTWDRFIFLFYFIKYRCPTNQYWAGSACGKILNNLTFCRS